MAGHDIIVIGASAGGVEALSKLVLQLPADLPATVLIVQHISATASGALAQILDRAGPLPATLAQDGETFKPAHIYVAPPNRHLLIKHGCLRLTRGPRENRVRPAIGGHRLTENRRVTAESSLPEGVAEDDGVLVHGALSKRPAECGSHIEDVEQVAQHELADDEIRFLTSRQRETGASVPGHGQTG